MENKFSEVFDKCISSSKSTEGTIKSSRLAKTRLKMGLKMGSNVNKSFESDGN